MSKTRKTSRWFKAALAAVLLIAIWILGAWWLAARLIVQKPLEKADVIVVLGGSATYVERTQKAAQLFRENISQKILLTDDGQRGGWSRAEQKNPFFVEKARDELIRHGVPAENIEILSPVVDATKDEAILVAAEASKNGWKSIEIVTSAYHSRRALWLFQTHIPAEKAEIGIVSPEPGQQTPPVFHWWLYRKGWNMVAGEYVKSLYYTILG